MEMLVSREWLRGKIAEDPDTESDAGVPVALLESINMFIPADLQSEEQDEKLIERKAAFGTFIRQLRRRDSLSVKRLASNAQVDERELQDIEHNPHHVPRPRTIYQLASHFKLPEAELMRLSGATRSVNQDFHEAALRFAAKSDDLGELTDREREALNDYVKYLNDIHEEA